MLKGISPILSPDLLAGLCAMGHGDEVVLADGHFPGERFASRRFVRADGVDVPRMLDAILAGERDPKVLARMADRRVRKSAAEIEAALQGDFRPEHLFVLGQALAHYRYVQQLIEGCGVEPQSRTLLAVPFIEALRLFSRS